MMEYFVESLTWSFGGLLAGAAFTLAILDLISHPQHKRRHRDNS